MGRNTIAQGNALGFPATENQSPERAQQAGPACCALSGLHPRGAAEPRALPWAVLFRPVGAFPRVQTGVWAWGRSHFGRPSFRPGSQNRGGLRTQGDWPCPARSEWRYWANL